MKKFFVIFILSSLIFHFSSPLVFAASNFSTKYDVLYTVKNDGVTNVKLTIFLKNITSQYYASSYKVKIGLSQIANVTASDPAGTIIPVLQKTDEGYIIELPFRKKVVGKNNTLQAVLLFDTNDITQREGEIWEVNIPGIANPNDFSDFTVMVKTPAFLGSPTYSKPQQTTPTLRFTKKDLGKAGVSLAFGKNQHYAFSLDYHLKNSNVFPIKTEIALPPSTNYQDVVLESIHPKPQAVRKDPDGNWLAEYVLLPTKSLTVQVKGTVAVFLHPKKVAITQDEITRYTKEQPYWEQSESIKKTAKELQTPRKIYDYVRRHLTYDFERVTLGKKRLGAAYVAEHKESAVCLEFTDLFIALARAAGIPAREVDGYAYTQNTTQRPISLERDILHAWPQYYDFDLETWVMVDPTWGNTTGGTDYFDTFDFDHITFAIKGDSSEYPIPAGGYKLSKANQKDITIVPTRSTQAPIPNLQVSLHMPEKTVAGMPTTGTIVIENKGHALYPSQAFTVETTSFVSEKEKYVFPEIPPYGTITIPLTFHTAGFLTNEKASVTIRLGEKSLTQHTKVSPLYTHPWALGIGGLFVTILTIIICIFAAATRRVSFFRR